MTDRARISGDRLTAEQVKKLPVGARVEMHGPRSVTVFTVTQAGKKKVLRRTDRADLQPIRELDERHYYTVEENE